MIRATVTEIYDMNTHIGALGLIAIHTPRSNLLFKHLAGLFMQFKRFKYNGARFSLIPAAQLPQDVAGVNVGAGDQMVDPRDIFNPILHKGFTGESLGAFLDKYLDPNSTRGASLDYTIGSSGGVIPDTVDQEAAYYQMLTQGGFRKMSPMGAIRNQKIYPMVYDLATTRQIAASVSDTYVVESDDSTTSDLGKPGYEVFNLDHSNEDTDSIWPSMRPGSSVDSTKTSRSLYMGTVRYGENGRYMPSGSFGLDPAFITPRKRKLGWMDTLQRVLPVPDDGSIKPLAFSTPGDVYTFTHLPKLNEYLIVTPPSYFNKLYYRLVLQHEVLFSGLRSATGASNAIDSSRVEYNNYMEQLPDAAAANSVEVLGGDVTPVTDGMASSIV